MTNFIAYIDESGDEGFNFRTPGKQGGSSRWFILASVLVDSSQDQKTSQAINRIKARLWPSQKQPWQTPLHWRELKHSQKKVALQEILKENFSIISVAFEKSHPKTQRNRFDSSIVRKLNKDIESPLYFYAARLLLERISTYTTRRNGRVDVVFENRATLSIPNLRSYISLVSTLESLSGKSTIAPGILTSISAENKQVRKMLQVADICAGAVSNALEPDIYGNVEESYFLDLLDKMDNVNGKTWGYGIKLFPGSKNDRLAEYTWLAEIK